MNMKIKCYSVRLEKLISISDKAYLAIAFDGSRDVIPKSCVFGMDINVTKSDAYWINSWILDKKDIQYSDKKQAWFDSVTRKRLPTYTIEEHTPEKVEPLYSNEIEILKLKE